LFKAALQMKPAVQALEKPAASRQGQPPVCPKCGVQMVVRTVKWGKTPGQQFYGCRIRMSM
jgi:hypothetical protein